MKPDFLIWMFDSQFPHACSLEPMEGFEEVFHLWAGEKLEQQFPTNARFTMRADRPTATVLTDSLHNNQRLLVISEGLKEFLQASDVPQLEFLKVAVRNHKGKVVPEKYYIINPLDPVDCLDRVASKAKVSRINKNRIDSIKKLVLNPSALPGDRRMFRIASFPPVHLVRRDLSDAITKKGFTGIRWLETSKYPEK
jgi:hypothetical protein